MVSPLNVKSSKYMTGTFNANTRNYLSVCPYIAKTMIAYD